MVPYVDLLKFLYRQRIGGFEIPTEPSFEDKAGTDWFADLLRRSELYLEYGSGGTTYLAAKEGRRFVSVESDKYFFRQLQDKIKHDGFYDESRQTYRHVNLGLTKEWGMPVVGRHIPHRRLEQFRQYSEFPFQGTERPDLILIDGRFRVACALKCLKRLKTAARWTMVVDDYTGRPHYHAIERFAELQQKVGRMAVFSGIKDVPEADLDAAIAAFQDDYR